MKWKHWSLAIAIAILFTIFVFLGVETFYPGPDFERYKPGDCTEDRYARPVLVENDTKPEYREDCYEYSNKVFEDVRENYEKNVFIIGIISSIIGIVLGITLVVESVSAGLLYGGILTLLISVIRFWGHLQDYARFIIVGLALGFLIWLGYKKLK
jgi:hypothetical protein